MFILREWEQLYQNLNVAVTSSQKTFSMAKHSVLSKELLIISQLNQSCDQCFNQDCGLTHPVQLLGAFYMTQCVNVTV